VLRIEVNPRSEKKLERAALKVFIAQQLYGPR
jgi:hypothetical protein